MSRVLVTGGAGFIGSHVADALIARGHDVTILDDLSGGFRENVPAAATFVQGSVTDHRSSTACSRTAASSTSITSPPTPPKA